MLRDYSGRHHADVCEGVITSPYVLNLGVSCRWAIISQSLYFIFEISPPGWLGWSHFGKNSEDRRQSLVTAGNLIFKSTAIQLLLCCTAMIRICFWLINARVTAHITDINFCVCFLPQFPHQVMMSNVELGKMPCMEFWFFWREYVFKIGTGYPACSKTRASRNQFQFVSQTFPWCHRSIRACLISLDSTRMKVCCAQSQRPLSPAPLLRRRWVF